MTWDQDRAFAKAARLLYREDFDLASSYVPKRGRSLARERMARRYEGWKILVDLASVAETANQARTQLATQGQLR